jgi:hypothetical protein
MVGQVSMVGVDVTVGCGRSAPINFNTQIVSNITTIIIIILYSISFFIPPHPRNPHPQHHTRCNVAVHRCLLNGQKYETAENLLARRTGELEIV